MTFLKHAAAACILAVIASSAVAGAPDNPGEKGDLIAQQKAIQQENGKNGWGQTVSDRAKNGSGSGAINLGDFLGMFAGGPNPYNDKGKGND